MRVLLLHHQAYNKQAIKDLLAGIQAALPYNHQIDLRDDRFLQLDLDRSSHTNTYNCILVVVEKILSQKKMQANLIAFQTSFPHYIPLICIGPTSPDLMELALQQGFDDYLPDDMIYRLPFLLSRWNGTKKALPDALYKLLYQDASEAILIMELSSSRLTAINTKALEILEETEDPVKKGKKITDYLLKSELEKKPLRLKQLSEGATLNDFRTVLTKTGKIKKISYTTRVIPNQQIIVIFRDVSPLFETKENLKQQEKLISLSEKMVGLGSIMYNMITGKTIWSDHMRELLGLSALDKNPGIEAYVKAIHPEDKNEVLSFFERLKTSRQKIEKFKSKHRIINSKGKVRIMAVNLKVEYHNDQPCLIYAAYQDITQREEELSQVRESQLILEQAGRISGLGIARWNATTNEVHWSKGIYNILELPEHKVKPSLSNIPSFLSEESRQMFWREAAHLAEQPGMETNYISPVLVGAKSKTLRIWAKSIKEDNKVIVYTAVQDITEHYQNQKRIKELNKQLEKALSEKEKELEKAMFRLKKIFDNNIIGIAVLDHNYQCVDVNNYLEELIGYKKTDLLGKPGLVIIHPDEKDGCEEDIRQLEEGIKGHCTRQHRIITKTGDFLWVKLHLSKVHHPQKDKELAILMVEDISTEKELEKERQEALQRLSDSEEKYRLLSEYSADMICAHDPDGRYTFVSEACKQMLGYDKEELLGKNPYSFFHPEDASLIRKKVHGPLLNQSQPQISINYRFRKKDGSYIWLNTRSKAILDKKNKVQAIHTYSSDVTKVIEAENRIKEALKKEREINELRSQFVTTASHQFRTPLSSIKASAQFLKMKVKNSDYQDLFQTIDNETNRLTSLMNDILSLGKINADNLLARKEYVDLVDLLQKVILQNIRSEKDDRNIKLSITGCPVQLYLDPNLTENALSNLISNALKYSKGAPPPKVDLAFAEKEASITIQDFGRGIPAPDQANLFTAFFRGRNVQDIQGTGLGLIIARQFIELNGGTLSFSSQLNKGSTFTVQLPVK